MSKIAIASIAFILVFSLTASIATAANFFAEKLDVIDSAYQDTVFGGKSLSNQRQNLIILGLECVVRLEKKAKNA